MHKTNRFLFIAVLVSVYICNACLANPDLEIIRKRIITTLMKAQVAPSRIEDIMENIQDDGRWSGINYEDVSRTGFQHAYHLSNLVELSRAYRKPGSPYQGDRKLKQVFDLAFDHWLARDYFCDNWWWNQIGTPNSLISVLLIMDEKLSDTQKAKAAPIVGRAHLNASGARPSGDRIKIAGILAKHLLFLRDAKQFDQVVKVIEGEVKFATGRGLQHDYSFHHRVDRVNNTLSYGLGYAGAFAEWAAYVADTRYAFSAKTQQHLIDYYLDGICKMMPHGKYPDPGAKNRSISRRGTLHPTGTKTLERLLKTSRYRSKEMTDILNIRRGKAKPNLSHSTFFWHSEYYSHQRPDYFTSVRMFSSRNHNMEQPYNSEGLKNHHLGDGANFISRTGTEYVDIAPVLDWQKIPGTTVLQKPSLPPTKQIQKRGRTDFVGAVTDGRYGAVVFDYQSPHDPLKAKKAWFFFDDAYICLGAGISSTSEHLVSTTLNQCLLRGDVIVQNNGQQSILKPGQHTLNKAAWIYHDNIAYLLPEPTSVNLSNQSATGSWYQINHQSHSSRKTIKKDVFKLWQDHGAKPKNASYQYIVLPSVSEKDLPECTLNHNIEVLENSTNIQAVKHTGLNIYQIIFHCPGKIQLTDKLALSQTTPGMVMLKTEGNQVKAITVSDPTRKQEKLHLTIASPFKQSHPIFQADWNPKTGTSNITINLPQTVHAGKSTGIGPEIGPGIAELHSAQKKF